MQTLINDLYGVLDPNGKVKDFAIDGTEMGVVTAQTNPLTGKVGLSAGGVAINIGGSNPKRNAESNGLVFARPAAGLFYESDIFSNTGNLTSYDSMCCYAATVDVNAIRVLVGNFAAVAGSSAETFPTQDLIYRLGIEVPGKNGGATQVIRVTFNGQETVVLQGNRRSYAWSDPIAFPIWANELFFVKTRITHADGTSLFSVPRHTTSDYNGTVLTGGKEGYILNNASDQSLALSSVAAWAGRVGGFQYRPLAVVADQWGSTLPVGSAVVIGDSIASPKTGYVNTILNAANIPSINLARSGEQMTDWPKNAQGRSIALLGNTAICEMGRNGVGTGIAAATASLQVIWRQLRAAGVSKIIQCTITPQTSSSDTWATVENQTGETNGFRVGINANIRSLVGAANGPDAIWDVEPLVTASGDLTKWAAGYTSDGLHPNTAGIAAIVAGATAGAWASMII